MYFRTGFVEFKDKIINNELANGIYVKSVSKPTTAGYYYTTTNIPNTNNTIYTTSGLQDKKIVVVFLIYAKSRQEKRQRINSLLKGWVGNESGRLVLGDDPDVYYIARILDEVKENETDEGTEVAVTFLTSALKYSFVETINSIAQGVTSKTIVYTGDYKALPIIEATGTGTITISTNGNSFSLVLANETVIVDCKELIVHDANYNSKIDKFTGDFVELYEGNNTVSVTGNTNVAIKIRHINTFLIGGSYA